MHHALLLLNFEFQKTMDDNWEVNSMMEFDHYQNIARAAFGDMLYDSDRVNIYRYNILQFYFSKHIIYFTFL
jgi:hypothetical protein